MGAALTCHGKGGYDDEEYTTEFAGPAPAVRNQHLDYYLDEFTFRFNRRTSRSRGLLFYRLM